MKRLTEFGEGIPMDSPIEALRALPHRPWDMDIEGINSILILPAEDGEELHDSGYRCMDFVACSHERAHCLLSGCSDVIHIGGISGFNNPDWVNQPKGKRAKTASWSIDCLPRNGLLRLFSHNGELIVGTALSSFEVMTNNGLDPQEM